MSYRSNDHEGSCRPRSGRREAARSLWLQHNLVEILGLHFYYALMHELSMILMNEWNVILELWR